MSNLLGMQYGSRPLPSTLIVGGLVLWFIAHEQRLRAHEAHRAATHQVTPTVGHIAAGPHVRLQILDSESSRPLAARFTLTVNRARYVPPHLGRHGLHFVSIHQRRNQQFVATYSRGSGDVLIPLPNDVDSGTVTVAKGFEFVPRTASFELTGPSATVVVRLQRWIDLSARGWHAADEHLHYERTAHSHDGDWLSMLDADGLSQAHFLVLKGGNFPGVWAQQFAHGEAGEATDGERWIRPGEEYRDATQGHINLLGVEEIIPPISTGGIGEPTVPFNYPPLLDVLRRAHELGGIGGPAHGASLARSSTAALDTVLGQVDFFEIANTHLYKTDVWYRLLNCGFMVSPVAGTDLPNFGFRDPWQPLLGEVRTYVRCGARCDFPAWKRAVRNGRVFVTSGPLIEFQAAGVGAGGIVRLPPQGGKILVTAELASPRPVNTLELISMGQPVATELQRTQEGGVHRLQLEEELEITKSCWLAVRGTGGPKRAVERGLGIRVNEMAHSGLVQVLVGDQPIRLQSDVEALRKQLVLQQEYYRTQANYEKPEHRLRFVELFEQALKRLD